MTNRATEVRLKGNGESGDDWPWVRLGDVCSIGRGRVISKPYINQNSGPYPVYSSQTQDEGVFGSIDTYDFEGEWVTWTTDGANAGRVFYRNGRFNCTNVCGTIKPHDDKVIHLPFLAIALNELTKPHVMIASGNPKLMNNVVKNVRVPLPPLPEQKRIAGILKEQLAAVERARAATEAQLEAAKALPAAYLREVFVSDEAKDWPAHAMENLSNLIIDGPHVTPEYQTKGVPFLTVRNIVNRRIDMTEVSFVTEGDHAEFAARGRAERGDILYTKDGTLGVPCVVDTDEQFSFFVSVCAHQTTTRSRRSILCRVRARKPRRS